MACFCTDEELGQDPGPDPDPYYCNWDLFWRSPEHYLKLLGSAYLREHRHDHQVSLPSTRIRVYIGMVHMDKRRRMIL
jgi:hypothetical protein